MPQIRAVSDGYSVLEIDSVSWQCRELVVRETVGFFLWGKEKCNYLKKNGPRQTWILIPKRKNFAPQNHDMNIWFYPEVKLGWVITCTLANQIWPYGNFNQSWEVHRFRASLCVSGTLHFPANGFLILPTEGQIPRHMIWRSTFPNSTTSWAMAWPYIQGLLRPIV